MKGGKLGDYSVVSTFTGAPESWVIGAGAASAVVDSRASTGSIGSTRLKELS
jgi:hypothetical protein